MSSFDEFGAGSGSVVLNKQVTLSRIPDFAKISTGYMMQSIIKHTHQEIGEQGDTWWQ